MEQDPKLILADDIAFLVGMKRCAGSLNNRLHDKLARLAIINLQEKFPTIEFNYENAGVGGIDITGKANEELVFVGEIKTTITNQAGSLMGAQLKSIKKDLERLMEVDVKNRYLILISKATKRAVIKQLKTHTAFPKITIYTCVDALPDLDTDTD